MTTQTDKLLTAEEFVGIAARGDESVLPGFILRPTRKLFA
jgi:hypothetical protein